MKQEWCLIWILEVGSMARVLTTSLHLGLYSNLHHSSLASLRWRHSNASRSHRLSPKEMASSISRSSSKSSAVGVIEQAIQLAQTSPATWESALLSNTIIFICGSPILLSGLSLPGIASAFLLGNLTWRAFGPSGFLLVASYFLIGTAVTKLKLAEKEAQGVAEKRRGRRGPGSVIGSSAAACVCAFLSIYGFPGLWELGFVASFCTKLSDTVSSEIGKAYGNTTYLVTTFKVVPRGTEGAVSIEGTVAGFLASILLAFVAFLMKQVNVAEAIVCVVASQIANFCESVIGAELQEKKGFQWVSDFVIAYVGSIVLLVLDIFNNISASFTIDGL
ncbi:hypothetical protein LIER_34159 [Lithospermum erythrorhizon]|uniref:Protein VTE6, chloroplastic n=1 Tax=Lithospermum erythrorhizon TaxID=34254 RepID=A0AAV3S3A3_LITER